MRIVQSRDNNQVYTLDGKSTFNISGIIYTRIEFDEVVLEKYSNCSWRLSFNYSDRVIECIALEEVLEYLSDVDRLDFIFNFEILKNL